MSKVLSAHRSSKSSPAGRLAGPAPLGHPAPRRPPRVVRPAHGTARLTLAINGQSYGVRPIAAEAFSAHGRAYRLRKADGTVYDVAETPHGSVCDCGDFIFHRD